MKKVFLFVLSCLAITAISAQNIVKEHYTVSGGLLGAINASQFRVSGNNTDGIDYDTKAGWAAGGWVNFPVSNGFSIEPQLLYSIYRYNTAGTITGVAFDGKIKYIEVPLQFKIHAGDKFAFALGPQVNFTSSVENKGSGSNAREEDFKQTSFSAFGGLEVFPHGRVTIFGRYVHGFTNMNNTGTEGSAPEFKNQNIQAGLKLKLFGKKITADSDGDGISDPNDKCPSVFGYSRYDGCPIPDSDSDGINDEADKCPNQAGTAKYGGCPIPDSDKDGINDEEDKCPNEAGIAKYSGCPIPDSDKDGINDEEDKCPNQAGTAKYNGCPVPDRDNDGINDEEDKCPDIAGTAANRGCPEVPADVSKLLSSSAQKISFGAGNAKLTASSNASLNQVVRVLKENPEMRLKIEGHTDNAGDDDKNMQLSEDRAAAVKAYIVSKGISEDRIESQGFGETMPVADNSTATGRKANRRVELKVVY
jgi:outer membrane protein OmpA-like peptidoglycan-associated protein